MYRRVRKAFLFLFSLCIALLGPSSHWDLADEVVGPPGLSGPVLAARGHADSLSQGETHDLDRRFAALGDVESSTRSSPEPLIQPPLEYLWGGVNNGDIFDEPDDILDEMLAELAKADLRVVRIWIDLRLEMDENGDPLPVGTYDDCLLEAVDDLMVKAKEKGILLLITLHQYNWLGGGSLGVSEGFYEWRKCKTPEAVYERSLVEGEQHVRDPYWERGWGYTYLTSDDAKDAYRQRVAHVLNHVNPHFGKPWKDINDVVWAWGLQNEPDLMPGWDSTYTVEQKRAWFNEMASYVKELDPDTYVALGTKYFSTLTEDLGNIEDADIYTVHYKMNADSVQAFQEALGEPYGKLLLLEEFYAARAQGVIFESDSEASRTNEVPWMFWEYGYNFDGDDLWHADGQTGDVRHADGVLWDAKVVPAAKKIWATVWDTTGVGKSWRVHEMVDDLCSQPDADCERAPGTIYLVDTFSAAALGCGYEWFDESTPDAYSLEDQYGYLRIEANLYQDLWGGTPLKRGAPLMLRRAPEGDYWVETFVSADPVDSLYSELPVQGVNTQMGLFVFQDVHNWIFVGLTNHDFPGESADGLIVTVTHDDESSIVLGSERALTEDYAFLRVERGGDDWRFYWKLQHGDPWDLLATVSLDLAEHKVGVGVKTLDVDPPLSPGRANFDFLLLGSYDVAPIVDVGPDQTVDEGDTVSLASAVFTYPGLLGTHTAGIDWGDGTSEEGAIDDGDGCGSVSASHVYGDNGSYIVTVEVCDEDGACGADELTVVVNNLSPVLALDTSTAIGLPGGDAFLGRKGTEQTHQASATDPGSDDLTFSWSFGATSTYYNDGLGPDPFPSPEGIVPFSASDNASNTFAAPGVQTVGVEVADDDGGVDEDSLPKLITDDYECTRTQGFWSHQFSGRGKAQFDADTLQAYLDIVNFASAIFSEQVPAASIEEARDVMGASRISMRNGAEAQLLAAWLNFAQGSVGWDELIDLDADGIGDAPFHQVVSDAEAILLDVDATHHELEHAKDLAEAVNLLDAENPPCTDK